MIVQSTCVEISLASISLTSISLASSSLASSSFDVKFHSIKSTQAYLSSISADNVVGRNDDVAERREHIFLEPNVG